ncbi:MAG: MFS transporter [Bdellovibrionaceae bacterium]|nr:MFS transporter [Pseudobdellovibrionaceae bacterium]NUM58843.1 MFS transporter [Pseudobdellovibrionaceae bacterium]
MKWKNIKYSLLEFSLNGIEVFLRLYLILYYTERVGLESYLVGLALGFSIFIDAFLDPLIGSYVDNFKAKNKQRFSLLKSGGIFYCFSFFALLSPPQFSNEYFDFFYLLIVSILFNISTSCLTIPYNSAVGDITSGTLERTNLIGWKNAVGNLGAFIGIGIPGIFLVLDSSTAYFNVKLVFSAILLFTIIVAYMTIKKFNINQESTPAEKITFERIFKNTTNPFLVLFLSAYFIAYLGLTINSSLAIYYYRLRLKLSEDEIQIVLGSFLLFTSLFVPFWSFLSRKINKLKLSLTVLFLMGISNCFIYIFLPPRSLFLTVFFASFLGGFFISVNFLLESILTDFVIYKEKMDKAEKMGFYYSLWKMSQKISRGLALVFSGFMLSYVGINGTDGAYNSYYKLAYAFGPGVGIFFILACLILLLLPRKYENGY